jgi:hypothetical protein
LINSTLSGNTAQGGAGGSGEDGVAPPGRGLGGGLFNEGTGTLTNVTVSGNSANWDGGGLYNGGGTTTLTNTIVAGNSAPFDLDIFGGYSGSHDLVGGDPMLAPLGDYGGPTQTMALLLGSPAIDAGDSTAPGLPSTDQRGAPRPDVPGTNPDIGAFEVQLPSLSPATPPDGTYGTAYSQALTATEAGYTGAFSFSFTSGTLPAGLSLASDGTLSGTPTAPGVYIFTVTATDSAGFTGSQGYTLTIDKATPTITWANPAAITYGTPLSSTQLDATASAVVNGNTVSVPGTFTYTLANGTTPALGAVLSAGQNQTLRVSFTPMDTTDFTAASGSTTLNVAQATPTLAWPNPAIVYGTALSGTQLDATAGVVVNGSTVSVPGTFTYTLADGTTPAAGAVLAAGQNQTLLVSFTPTDTTDFTAASGSTTLDVGQATPTLTWPNPAAIVYGTALGGAQLDATASVPGTFRYTLVDGTTAADGAVLPAGQNQTLKVTFTPADTTDYTTATAGATINVDEVTPTLTWAEPAAVVYGTPLGGTQLDATANVPGTFSYNVAAGTILGAGPQTLSVTFTPTDSANYATATASVTLTVLQATPTLTWADPAAVVYGTPLDGTQLDATANGPGTFSYSVAPGAILAPGVWTLTVTFTPADSADYHGVSTSVQLGVVPAVPALQAAFLAGVAPQGTPAIGPVVVFNDPVFFGRKALQLRDRHGHSVRLRLQVLYLPTGQTVVILSWGTGRLSQHDLVAGKCVLTIDGRQVFDSFGRGPLVGVQKLRSFPVLSDPGALAPLAAALGLPSPA